LCGAVILNYSESGCINLVKSKFLTCHEVVEDIEDVNDTQGDQIATLQDDVALIGDYPLVTATTNTTTTGRAFYNVTTASVVITLNASPDNGEQIIVHKNTGNNGDYIDVTDGTGTTRIVVDQSVISYRYSTTLGNWVVGG